MNAAERRPRCRRGMSARCPRRRGTAAPPVALLALAWLFRAAAAGSLGPFNTSVGRYPVPYRASLSGVRIALLHLMGCRTCALVQLHRRTATSGRSGGEPSPVEKTLRHQSPELPCEPTRPLQRVDGPLVIARPACRATARTFVSSPLVLGRSWHGISGRPQCTEAACIALPSMARTAVNLRGYDRACSFAEHIQFLTTAYNSHAAASLPA